MVVAFASTVLPVRVVEASVAPVSEALVLKTATPEPLSSVRAAASVADEKLPNDVVLPTEVTTPERLALVVTVAALPEIEPLMVEVKVFEPEKVFEFARSVEEAAVMVMFEVPSKLTPLMVRPVWSAVAVEALPVRLPMRPLTALSWPPMVVEPVVEMFEAVRPPLNAIEVLVALPGNGYAKMFAEVR